jgi:hypothetical protein
MANTKKISTQVYELPADQAARTKFLDGVKALADECKATWLAGSVHNEMDYADLLAEELTRHVGEQEVENIRQEFERK